MKRGRELPKSHSCQISVLPDMAALRGCPSMCMCANALGDGFAIPEFCAQHFRVFLKCSCMLTYVPGNLGHAFVCYWSMCVGTFICVIYTHVCVLVNSAHIAFASFTHQPPKASPACPQWKPMKAKAVCPGTRARLRLLACEGCLFLNPTQRLVWRGLSSPDASPAVNVKCQMQPEGHGSHISSWPRPGSRARDG